MKWFVIILFLFLGAKVSAQNNPAMAYGADYVLIDVKVAARNDPNFSFLFEKNEESYNKKPFVQQLLDLAFDKSLTFDFWEIDRKKEDLRPLNYNKLISIRLDFAVFYKNGVRVYHHIARIVLEEYIDYADDGGYVADIFSVSDQKSMLMYFLDSRFIPGRNALTYWEFFYQAYKDDIYLMDYLSFMSLSEAEKLCNRNVWNGFQSEASFEYPKKLSEEAVFEVSLIKPEVEDSFMFELISRNRLHMDFMYDEPFDFCSQYPNYSLFLPFYNLEGYKNLSYLICFALNNNDYLFYNWNEGVFFDRKLTSETLKLKLDSVDVMYHNDVEIHDVIDAQTVLEVFNGFYLLTLNQSGQKYPLAIAPASITEGKGLFWILFNQEFRNLLFKYEVYCPARKALSFGEYFQEQLYKGETISQKTANPDAWKELYSLLK